MVAIKIITCLLSMTVAIVMADYTCICNYNIEKVVYDQPNIHSNTVGYLYEFDCKPLATVSVHGNSNSNFFPIEFEGQLGYVGHDARIEEQTCPGEPPAADRITTKATKPHGHSTTTTMKTTTTTIPTTTTPKPSTSSTTTTTTQTLTTTTTPKPTTTTPKPTTTSTTTTTTTPSTPTTQTTTPTTSTTPKTPKPTTTSTTTTSTTPTTTTTIAKPTPTGYPYWLHEVNVTGTPLENIGVGYNLLKGNPEMSSDPGLLLDKRVLLLTGDSPMAVKEASYTLNTSCSPQQTHYLVHGSKSLQQEMNAFVNYRDTKHPITLTADAYTYNTEFINRRTYIDSGSKVYQDLFSTCTRGSATYNIGTGSHVVSHSFAKAVCALPLDMFSSISSYMKFLEIWGTSVVTSATLGSRQMDRYSLTRHELFKHVLSKDSSVIDHAGGLAGYSTSLLINVTRFSHSSIATDRLSLPETVNIGSKSYPGVVGITLVPLSQFIDWNYFAPVMQQLISDGDCPSSFGSTEIQQLSSNLLTALSQYGGHLNKLSGYLHHPAKDVPVQIPVTWPLGVYVLMKTARGCPGDQVTWYTGWRQHDTEDSTNHNDFPPNIGSYLAGVFGSNIRTEFCTKTRRQTSTYDMDWPRGSYCILKKGACPTGFSEGFIYWDDEDINNGNHHEGMLPDGVYNENTKIFYCCRDDDSVTKKIILPTGRPFVLIRYTTACQQVHGMDVTDVFVRWDDNDLLNGDSSGGMHPYDEGGAHDHQLHFCYYQKTGTSGIIIG